MPITELMVPTTEKSMDYIELGLADSFATEAKFFD
jgi:hypothetical protein